MWWKKYETLKFKGGKPKYILEDDQDMIEIRYDDGMLIDIGYLDFLENEKPHYEITVVVKDDKSGWENPLVIIKVEEKDKLYNTIQQTINTYRNI